MESVSTALPSQVDGGWDVVARTRENTRRPQVSIFSCSFLFPYLPTSAPLSLSPSLFFCCSKWCYFVVSFLHAVLLRPPPIVVTQDKGTGPLTDCLCKCECIKPQLNPSGTLSTTGSWPLDIQHRHRLARRRHHDHLDAAAGVALYRAGLPRNHRAQAVGQARLARVIGRRGHGLPPRAVDLRAMCTLYGAAAALAELQLGIPDADLGLLDLRGWGELRQKFVSVDGREFPRRELGGAGLHHLLLRHHALQREHPQVGEHYVRHGLQRRVCLNAQQHLPARAQGLNAGRPINHGPKVVHPIGPGVVLQLWESRVDSD
eukprot:RCo016955